MRYNTFLFVNSVNENVFSINDSLSAPFHVNNWFKPRFQKLFIALSIDMILFHSNLYGYESKRIYKSYRIFK